MGTVVLVRPFTLSTGGDTGGDTDTTPATVVAAGPFVVDDFNRTASAGLGTAPAVGPGASGAWDALNGTFAIVTGDTGSSGSPAAAEPTGSTSDQLEVVTLPVNDYYLRARMPREYGSCIALRVQDNGDLYVFNPGDNSNYPTFYKKVGGSYTMVWTGTDGTTGHGVAVSSANSYAVLAIGDSFTLYQNDIALVTITDSTYPTGGTVGIRADGETGGNLQAQFNDFVAIPAADLATGLQVYAHSYMTDPPQNGHPDYISTVVDLQRALGLTVSNYAVGGYRMVSAALSAVASSPGESGGPMLVDCVVNDQAHTTGTAAYEQQFTNAVQTLVAISKSTRTAASTATSSGFTASGSDLATSTAGSSLTFDDVATPAGTLYVLGKATSSTALPTFTVTVDGTAYTFTQDDGFEAISDEYQTTTSAPWVQEITGLGTGTHTVVVEATSADELTITGLLQPVVSPPKCVIVLDPVLATSNSGDTGFTSPANANRATFDTLVLDAAGDGADVAVVDLEPYWSLSFFDTDNIHPLAAGYGVIAGLVVAPLRS